MAKTYDLISSQLLCEADGASEPREAGPVLGISSSLGTTVFRVSPSLSSGLLSGHRSHAWFSRATHHGPRAEGWDMAGRGPMSGRGSRALPGPGS